jgi:hypothetical protein
MYCKTDTDRKNFIYDIQVKKRNQINSYYLVSLVVIFHVGSFTVYSCCKKQNKGVVIESERALESAREREGERESTKESERARRRAREREESEKA